MLSPGLADSASADPLDVDASEEAGTEGPEAGVSEVSTMEMGADGSAGDVRRPEGDPRATDRRAAARALRDEVRAESRRAEERPGGEAAALAAGCSALESGRELPERGSRLLDASDRGTEIEGWPPLTCSLPRLLALEVTVREDSSKKPPSGISP